jgi:hypothetical protein
MTSDRINGEQPSTIEWGGGAADPLGGRLDWLTTERPVLRGAGIGCAVAAFGLLVAAELLPWMVVTTSSLQQDFPTGSGGRVEAGLTQLGSPTEIFSLGWLVVLAAVATALVVRPPFRRVVVAAGLGLIAGQLALLVGITRGIKHPVNPGLFRGGFAGTDLPIQFGLGVYCAYAALVLLVLALAFAGGVPRQMRDSDPEPAAAQGHPDPRGPADLTVTPLPVTDLSVWSQREMDINVKGPHPER